MKMKLFGILAILLIGVFAIGGCVATPGATGPAGPQGEPGDCTNCPECDCAGGGSLANFVIVAENCPSFGDEVYIFGSGFPAEKTVTLYFWGEDKDTQVKWLKVDTNEVGAFAIPGEVDGKNVEVTIPTYAEFNEDILKDVSVTNSECCNEVVALTVGAYVGGDCVATFPLILPAEAD